MSAGVSTSAGEQASVTSGDRARSAQNDGARAVKSNTPVNQDSWAPLAMRAESPIADLPAIARRNGQLLAGATFRARVAEWRTSFDNVSNSAVALYVADGFEFSAMLLGAWQAGKTVYLPGDAENGTCRALKELHIAFAGEFPADYNPLQRAVTTDSETRQFTPLHPGDTHVVIFTSGSTGVPQAVPKLLGQLIAEVETLERQFGEQLSDDALIVATVSHQHIYGLLFKILWPLHAGRTFESESVLYPEQLALMLQDHRCAIVSGPAHLKRLPDSIDWSRARQNALAIFSSGGPLALDSAAHVEQLLGVAPLEVYGSSETGGIAWRQRSAGVEQAWSPLAGIEVRAEDGRLAVRSSHLATRAWYTIEDFAEFETDGRFVLRGRSDRLAKIEGKRVSLVAMESALLASGYVAEVRLVQLEGTRDEIAGVAVPSDTGWTELRERGSQSLRRCLNKALAGTVERLALPRRWRWVDALPSNATGKTTNAAAVALFSGDGSELPTMHVLSSSAGEAILELYVSRNAAVFDGHFVNVPVLAGVAQVEWAIQFGRRMFGIDAHFDRMEAIKFQRVYQGVGLLRLQLGWNSERRLLTFRIESGDSTHSSGRIFFAA